MLRSILASAALFLAPEAFAQTTWYVDVTAPGPGTGTQQDPYPSIQQAIDASATLAGDTIQIAAGVYLESLDLGGKTLRLAGDPIAPPLIRGNALDRLLRVTSGEGVGTEFVSLSFVGGTGGQTGFRGGAVLVESSTAAFESCSFSANRQCSGGGAVGAIFADVSFEACTFVDNSAGMGGAISAEDGSIVVRNCHFERNTAGQVAGCSGGNGRGGAISTGSAAVEIVDSVFVDNVGGTGGALFLDGNPGGDVIERCSFERNGSYPPAPNGVRGGAAAAGGFRLTDCVFRNNGGLRGGAAYGGTYRTCLFEGNTANYGGAAYQALVIDCVLRDNHALELNSNAPEGGATHSSQHIRCVMYGNSAALGAGACDNAVSVDRCTIVGNRGYPSYIAVRGAGLSNSIVWGNEAVSPVGPLQQVDVNAMSFSMVEGDPNSIAGPPLLFGRYEGDAHLLPGSPAIDAGSQVLPPDPDGSPADIGALTFDPAYRAGPARFCESKTTADGCDPEIALSGLPSLMGAPARVEVRGVPVGTAGILLLSRDAQAAPFFGGTLCVGGSIVRSGVESAIPASGCGHRLEFSLGPQQLAGVGVVAGDLVFAQVWFRDVFQPDGTGIGISDAIVATVAP